ncbi:DUF3592 domain-containing protein [Salinibacterium sp. ZJ77]|uniref:DUF3592 domain-containing protein n=1 Tax=Salinibacterium sp. ZJ77 TaxID=2708337 RepID=UPI0014231B8B|nr:DUF3592 domain-containing protein [Salinibacterium sp. ZJ77]
MNRRTTKRNQPLLSYWPHLLVIACCAAIVLALGFAVVDGQRKQEVMSSGAETHAHALGIERFSSTRGHNIRYKVRYQYYVDGHRYITYGERQWKDRDDAEAWVDEHRNDFFTATYDPNDPGYGFVNDWFPRLPNRG